MSFDKTRFTRDPHLDSEGFVNAENLTKSDVLRAIAAERGWPVHEIKLVTGAEPVNIDVALANAHLDGWPPGIEAWADPDYIRGLMHGGS